MFLENASQKGWIEVICGSMFSGKTEELIRRLKRAEFARLRVEIFKPRIDVRYSEEEVVSHDASAIRSTPVDSAQNILLMTSDVDVVGIDEAQFFDQGLVEVCRQLADSGVRVIVAGLDMDFTGKPFGPMPALMATAEYVTKVHAISNMPITPDDLSALASIAVLHEDGNISSNPPKNEMAKRMSNKKRNILKTALVDNELRALASNSNVRSNPSET